MAVCIQLRRDTAADWTSNNPTLANGEPGIETDTGKWKVGDGSTVWISLGYYAASILSKSLTLENPTGSEDLSIWFTPRAITVTEMRCVLRGSGGQSLTWTVRHGSDRSAAGNEVVTGGTTTTSTTTGSDVTSFNDETVDADSFIWLETTAIAGTVNTAHITIVYTEV